MNALLRIAIPVVILALGWGAMKGLSRKEEPEARERRRGSLPKVHVVELLRSNFDVTIGSQGVVRAHNSTSLTPRVSGRILKVHPQFQVGAFFKEGEVLVELDPADFEAAMASADARVARAEAALAQEEARAKQALLDWRDLGYEDEPGPLVLREPQLKQARAELAASLAEQTAATRDFERSKVLAPYDGCVLMRAAGPGQSVSSGSVLGEIFSTDFAEIRLPLSADDLSFFTLPEENTGSPIEATLYDALGAGSEDTWTATIVRTEGALDESSRKLFVIARVEDPYGLHTDHPALRVGQPVRAEIAGTVLEDVYVLPREGLRSPTEVVLVNPEDLTIQRTEIEPVWSDATQVVVRDDLPEGWLLVVSQLSSPANGSRVEIIEDTEETEGPLDELKAAQSPGTKPEARTNTGA